VKFQKGHFTGGLTGLALWVREQKNLYLQGLEGKIQAMRDDRVKKLEEANFVWAKVASRSPALARRSSDVQRISRSNAVASKMELVKVHMRVPDRSVGSQTEPPNSQSHAPERSAELMADSVVFASNGVSSANSVAPKAGPFNSKPCLPADAQVTVFPESPVTQCSMHSPADFDTTPVPSTDTVKGTKVFGIPSAPTQGDLRESSTASIEGSTSRRLSGESTTIAPDMTVQLEQVSAGTTVAVDMEKDT
jgi:hypothetical protein